MLKEFCCVPLNSCYFCFCCFHHLVPSCMWFWWLHAVNLKGSTSTMPPMPGAWLAPMPFQTSWFHGPRVLMFSKAWFRYELYILGCGRRWKWQLVSSAKLCCSYMLKDYEGLFLVGGFSTHLKNISQIWITSPSSGEINNYLKPPPSIHIYTRCPCSIMPCHVWVQFDCAAHVLTPLGHRSKPMTQQTGLRLGACWTTFG